MHDPVILCESGVSYERMSIEDWLRNNRCGSWKKLSDEHFSMHHMFLVFH